MAYDIKLADKVREYLFAVKATSIEEKKMFSGLAFLVNGKMCINISGNNLMCRFDAALHETVAEKAGYLPMIMKGKELAGYCYVEPVGFKTRSAFGYWMKLCLDFNKQAKLSKRRIK